MAETSVELAKDMTCALVEKLVLQPNIHTIDAGKGLAEWVGNAYLTILKKVNEGYNLK